MIKKKIMIQNKLGLHARASMKLINTAGRFQSEIIIKYQDAEVNAKSIMNIMGLAVSKGTEIELIVDGPDEEEATTAITQLIANRFDEEE